MLPNGQSSVQRTHGKLSSRVTSKAVLHWTWGKWLNLRSLQFPLNIKTKKFLSAFLPPPLQGQGNAQEDPEEDPLKTPEERDAGPGMERRKSPSLGVGGDLTPSSPLAQCPQSSHLTSGGVDSKCRHARGCKPCPGTCHECITAPSSLF